jgi:uncharacterized protein YdeI (YjbR/CyaY-like superfamily)
MSERVEFESVAQLRAWLDDHHAQSPGIWAITFKRSTPTKYVSREEILDEVLCFGWIDGARQVLDDERTMQYLSPRKTDKWARTYQVRVARLIAEGKMHSAGLEAVQRAQESGEWNELSDVDDLLVPSDLKAALLARNAVGRFDTFPPSYRRNVLRWIATAKSEATRSKRVDQTAESTADGSRIKHL